MAWKYLIFHLTTFILPLHCALAQIISTDTPVPPLQWINLSGLLQGSSRPPPLKNAAIGYDETSRSMIIFGGESESGLSQFQTYLLNLETLTWSIPTPPPNLQRTPAARAAAIAGCDFAASNRHGFVVIGGKGSDGKGLKDVWEYDFINQFWSEVNVSPGGPSPRWGASGGIDIFTPPIQDPIVPGPNNTFYLAGGYDGTQALPLSDVWRLNISGTLSSNLPNDSTGSWEHLSIGHAPPKFNQAGTIISQRMIAVGGCNLTASNDTCAGQDSYIIDVQRRSEVSPSACPAPRTGSVLVPNANRFSSTFLSQVYLLLGTLDKTRWDDDDGLVNGEIAVLDINTISWSRILPSGDPGNSNSPKFPSPREGSAAFSYPSALVGQSRTTSSDTLVFGGQDSSGNLLSELWLLRAYNGIVNPSNLEWSGFGDGRLQTGINANGSGVRMTYMSKCASMVDFNNPQPTTTSISSSMPRPSSSTPVITSQSSRHFDTSLIHKILAPLSLAIFQVMFLFFRFVSPLYQGNGLLARRTIYGYISIILALVAYALGAAGIATSFSTTSVSTLTASAAVSTERVPSPLSLHLQTGHGIAGLIFFVLLYGLIPAVLAMSELYYRFCSGVQNEQHESRWVDATEKPDPFGGLSRSTPYSIHNTSPPSSPRHRTNSWGPSSMMHRSYEGRMSSDSESISSATPRGGFEVVNRPSRARRASGSGLTAPLTEGPLDYFATRSLRDVDWLQRRRSLNAVGELDYAITQARREQSLSTPATADGLVTTTISRPPPASLGFPKVSEIVLHIVIQVSLLGMCIVTLVALWLRAPKAAFIVFLAWTIAFYLIMLIFAWRVRTSTSIFSVICNQLRSDPHDTPAPTSHPTPVEPSLNPYVHHQPPYRLATGPFDGSLSPAAPQSTETSDYDDDIDDDRRQRMIEEEMGRRDVSIITVPKRRLWVANPS